MAIFLDFRKVHKVEKIGIDHHAIVADGKKKINQIKNANEPEHLIDLL